MRLLLPLSAALVACRTPSPYANCEVSAATNDSEEPYETIWYDAAGAPLEREMVQPPERVTWINDDRGRPLVESVDIGDDGEVDFRTLWFYRGNELEREELDLDMDGYRDEYTAYRYDSRGRVVEEAVYAGWSGEDPASRTTREWSGDLLVVEAEDANADGQAELEWRYAYDEAQRITERQRVRVADGTGDTWTHSWSEGDDGLEERVEENLQTDDYVERVTVRGYDADGHIVRERFESSDGYVWSQQFFRFDELGRKVREEYDWNEDGEADQWTDWTWVCEQP